MEGYWANLTLAEFWSRYDIVYEKSKPNKYHIPLKNELGFIKKRKERCVLRYYLNYENDEDFKSGCLILFYPFVDEMKEIHE